MNTQTNKARQSTISTFITNKHKGLKVSLRAILSGTVLMSNRKGEVVQVNKPLTVLSSDRRNVILSDDCGHTLKLPINSGRILSFT